ncbi:uncharacterized protein [Leptinotarsa decemlineata]|uniref:uncharacterized protein n=1 Tax=Leptinotarsa decemlineata TaxID=7539 RepID=UPI003D308840
MEEFVSLSNMTMRKPVEEPSRTLNVIVYNMHPFVIYDHNLGQLDGYLGDIWNIIQETGQMKTNITVIKTFSEGEDLIELGKTDIFLGAGVALENQSNTYYTQPFLVNWYHLYLKTPKVKGSTHSYLETFSANLWFATCGLFMILSLTVFLTIKLLNRWQKVEPSVSLPSCFLGVVSGFINQEFNLKLVSISGRIQVFFSLLLGVVLFSSMNAVLFS